jgi:hypothetical protein
MSYISEAGNFQLKPVAWEPFTYPDGGQALKFHFENREGAKCEGVFSFTKKDGSENENIKIFSDAFEAQKSVLCEVQQGKPKNNGGHFYTVKWAVTKKSDAVVSTSAKELREFLSKKPKDKEPEKSYPSDEIPF